MGFIKVSDRLRKWAWINEPKTAYIYLRLILDAAWESTDCENVHLERGQLAISQREYANAINVTYQELRTALTRLNSTQKITQSVTHKISIITLLEYDCETQSLTQSTTQCQRNNNAMSTQCQRTYFIKYK